MNRKEGGQVIKKVRDWLNQTMTLTYWQYALAILVALITQDLLNWIKS